MFGEFDQTRAAIDAKSKTLPANGIGKAVANGDYVHYLSVLKLFLSNGLGGFDLVGLSQGMSL
jgi:hypothetical protein